MLPRRLKKNSSTPSTNDLKFAHASVRDLATKLNTNQMNHWDFIKDAVEASNVYSRPSFVVQVLGRLSPHGRDGSASWYPSVLGHELRAFNHVYVWLNAWKNAVVL